MIINIPLQIDEQKMEEVLARDYESKISKEITNYIGKVLRDRSGYRGTETDGMKIFIEQRIDDFLKDHKDEIIEMAANELAIRLARSKRGKELLKEDEK